jgi:hypothetical protein
MGYIVDGIEINGQIFGSRTDDDVAEYRLAAGEKIKRISYQKVPHGWWTGTVREIIFHSNIKDYRFAAVADSNTAFSSDNMEYSITISPTENLLYVFQSSVLTFQHDTGTYFGGLKKGKFTFHIFTSVVWL